MKEWFTDYKDVIAGIAGIATAIGLIATALALAVGAMQIRQQRHLARAQAVYEIQRDAREMTWLLVKEDSLAEAVYGGVPDKRKVAIGTSINFYSAAFQMWKDSVLDDALWNLFAEDLVDILQGPEALTQWLRAKDKEAFDKKFVEDVERRREVRTRETAA